MKRFHFSAALCAFYLFAPNVLHAQEAAQHVAKNTCVLMGNHFSKGATVRITGERVRCHGNDDGIFWNRNVEGDENSNSFIFCVHAGEFYSQGAVLDDVTCNGSGNWE